MPTSDELENIISTGNTDSSLSQENNISDIQATENVQEVSSITLEDFKNLNNNIVLGFSSLLVVLGIISGLFVGYIFKGIFRQ